MRRLYFLLVLAWLAAAAPAWAQFNLQHFQCYPTLKVDPEVAAVVELSDQFSEFAPEVVDVRRAKRFCNPAAKFHPGIDPPFFPITDDRQHLTFYATYPQQAPLRVAEVQNQFGLQRLLLRAPVALAVPTRKIFPGPHEPPVGLDHFRCYAAWGLPVNQGVALSDQLIPQFSGHQVLNPVAFCNPARKVPIEPPGPPAGIQNPDLHLTCYSMTRVRFEGDVSIENQFGAQRLALGSPDTICVPSRKLNWFPIEDAAPGDSIDSLGDVSNR